MVPDEWIRMRIEVAGRRARLYLGDDPQPALIVNDLKLGDGASGGVALWTGPGTLGHFADVRVTPARHPSQTRARARSRPG